MSSRETKMDLGPDDVFIEPGSEGQRSREGQERVKCQNRRDEVKEEDDDDEGDDNEEDDEEDEDESGESEPGGNDENSQEGRRLKLHGIHLGINQPMLRVYINERTHGLKEIEELCVEEGSRSQTQTARLLFRSGAAAQEGRVNLSNCQLGPGGREIQVDVVDAREQPLLNDGQSPVKGSADKRKQRTRRRPQKHRAVAQAKTKQLEGSIEAQSLLTLEVRNIGIKLENFKDLLAQLKVPSCLHLQWKTLPNDEYQAFLQFDKKAAAKSAQDILNACSIGSAHKKLVTILQDRLIKDPVGWPGGNQRGGMCSKTGQTDDSSLSATGSSFPSDTDNCGKQRRMYEQRSVHYHSRGRGGRSTSQRSHRRRSEQSSHQDDESDRLSVTSETMSNASRKSFASSSVHRGRQSVKSDSLHITRGSGRGLERGFGRCFERGSGRGFEGSGRGFERGSGRGFGRNQFCRTKYSDHYEEGERINPASITSEPDSNLVRADSHMVSKRGGRHDITGERNHSGASGYSEPDESNRMMTESQKVSERGGRREKKTTVGLPSAGIQSLMKMNLNLAESQTSLGDGVDKSPHSPGKFLVGDERRTTAESSRKESGLRKDRQTLHPEQKTGNQNQLTPSPNEVIITDLPRDISEKNVVDVVKKEKCEGFKDARLYKDSITHSSKCLLKFRERMYAMDAVSKLYGKPINGHRIQVHLSLNHDQMEPAIARKLLVSFQEKEMPNRVAKIKEAIVTRIETIESELKNLTDTLEEDQSFAELEQCESTIRALAHQSKEQRRYLNEFLEVSEGIEAEVKLQVRSVSALSDVQKIRHHFERECRRAESPLPVYGYRSKIQSTISENQAVVLQGETGSGKSTQIPQYIVDLELRQGCREDLTSGGSHRWRVACTQPRRVAALTLAKRVAEEYGCRVGEEIGFHVGNKKSVGANTVVTFMTDRKLLNLCIADPNLSDYTCVIVDEAHERSVDTDILLATLKKLLQKRKDLHLLIMSATIDIKLFTDYLGGCQQLSITGRTFPVDKCWHGNDAGIGEGNYVGKAVQLAAQLHKDEDEGDILVFLTSANEIETACRDLAVALGHTPDNQDEVLILPLHGRLQPDDQMKVFAEQRQGQRKIVFATNVAETSVTIKGIKYVIDPGVVKECQYDPKRSMSLLKVTMITRASAEQRAGRAGRTAPGICYRLYSKQDYSEMEETMKPEILRVHLGMAALQLLELGVEDVENFDFIQVPDREATKQAMTTLRLLGAVDELAKLTPLGRKMATLQLEPRLSKMVLEGAERGMALEAVMLAALISAPGSIFYRGGSDKDKEKSDRLKLQFCHESGDVLTMLSAYGQWHKELQKDQKAWCMKNSMNSKTLRATEETVKEVCQILKREHGIDCNYNDKMWAPAMEKSETLQKLIMSAYFQTLSLYNGHHRAGYTILGQQKTAHIHPSAALKSLGVNPKWLVYQEFKRTSRDFLFNVTQVDVGWLEEVAPVFYRETNLKALQEMAMQELPPIPLGTALMRRLSAKRNEKLRELEERITTEKDSPCIIEIKRDVKELLMFVSKQFALFAVSYVQTYLDEELKMIERQQIEVPVGESGVVRQVIAAGGATRFILMAQDYRALEISNMPTDATEDEVERIVRFAGCSREEILDVYRFPKHSTTWGRVTFISPESAESAKECLDAAVAAEETSLSVRALQGRGFQKPDIRRVNTRAVITWFTWPSKGNAFINCDTTEDACKVECAINTSCQDLRGSSLNCTLKRNNTRALFIGRINKDVSQEELEAFVRRRTDIPFRCSIFRERPQVAIEIPTADIMRDIYSMFDVLKPNEMNIDILRPKSSETQMHKAIVTFSGDTEGQVGACVDLPQDYRNSAGQLYHVKLTSSFMLFCKRQVYRCLQGKIDCLVQKAKSESEDLIIRVDKSKKTSDQVIYVSGGNIQEVQAVRRLLLADIQGETLSLADLIPDEMTNQKMFRLLEILQNTLSDSLRDIDAHAFVDARRQVIVIFGSDSAKERLKDRLRNYVGNICSNMLREISLASSTSPQCTKGRAIRALVRAYGPWLKKLQEESRATKITLNTRQGVVLIEGGQKEFDKVHDMVESCLREAGLGDSLSTETDERPAEEVECGICYTSVEGSDEVYRLSACSHGFHQDCLKEMFTVRLKEASKDYPIECPSDGCGRALLLCDIRILCPDESNRQRLFQWALQAHVMQTSNGELKFCPTADCCMIYKHTGQAQTFVCPECRSRLCSSCGAEPHSGQTCDEFKISSENFDNIEMWMRTSGKDVKKCPNPHCGFMIERLDGCNRVACISCKKHICWTCRDYFDSANDCYAHLAKKHGGYF